MCGSSLKCNHFPTCIFRYLNSFLCVSRFLLLFPPPLQETFCCLFIFCWNINLCALFPIWNRGESRYRYVAYRNLRFVVPQRILIRQKRLWMELSMYRVYWRKHFEHLTEICGVHTSVRFHTGFFPLICLSFTNDYTSYISTCFRRMSPFSPALSKVEEQQTLLLKF